MAEDVPEATSASPDPGRHLPHPQHHGGGGEHHHQHEGMEQMMETIESVSEPSTIEHLIDVSAIFY